MGLQIQTVKGISKERKIELVGYLQRCFRSAVDSRSQQVDGLYRRWVDNYAAKPLEAIRTTPFYKASNFVPRLIGMHTDILAARIIGLMFGTRPFWKMSPYDLDTPADELMQANWWLDRKTHNEIQLFNPLDLGIFLTCKTGVNVFKSTWLDEKVFKPNGSGSIEGVGKPKMCVDTVPFDDFFPFPVTAIDLTQCSIKFHRLRFTKEEIELRKNSNQWNKVAAEQVILSANQVSSTARDTEANNAGISLTMDNSRPYNIVEAWLKYELIPGQQHDIVVTFNPYISGETSLLRDPYYNYFPDDLDAFDDLRIMPRENLFWGMSVPEILEQAQEEKAQIHNGRRDANLVAMVPGWKKKRFSDVANPSTEWYPGKVFEVDSMDDLEALQFNSEYTGPSMEEEGGLDAYAERLTGGGPAQQGFGTGPLGKKGIYASQATLALLSEGNKRLDIDLKRVRRPMHGLGKRIFCAYRDWSDTKEGMSGESLQTLQRAFALSKGNGGNGLFFEIGASDAGANQEVDRQNILLMSNTMQGYYKEIMSIAPQIAGMPDGSPAKVLALAVLDGARDLANRILFLFNIPGKRALVPDVRALLGGGTPAPRSAVADQVGLPQAEDSLPGGGVQDQAANIAAVTAGLRSGANGAGSNGAAPM